jgi:hypothetical protein
MIVGATTTQSMPPCPDTRGAPGSRRQLLTHTVARWTWTVAKSRLDFSDSSIDQCTSPLSTATMCAFEAGRDAQLSGLASPCPKTCAVPLITTLRTIGMNLASRAKWTFGAVIIGPGVLSFTRTGIAGRWGSAGYGSVQLCSG